MRKERMGMGLNLLLLLAMVATNILSLYHLASLRNPNLSHLTTSNFLEDHPVPDHLLHQLHTIRATISHLSRLQNHHPSPSNPGGVSSAAAPPPPPPELVLYSKLSPIASACAAHPDLLRRYMTYVPFSSCPQESSAAADPLLLRGCHPLPRRRCFSPSPLHPIPSNPFSNPLPDSAVVWPTSSRCRSFSCLSSNLGFDPKLESIRFLTSSSSPLDLTLPQLFHLAGGAASIRLGIDVAGGSATLAAQMRRLSPNATILTTTLNLGAPYSEAAALRGVVPLHAPLQQRFPVPDGSMDLVRVGRAVNRWIPGPVLEFLWFDVERVLRGGGWVWIDRFFCKSGDLEGLYEPMIGRLGYKRVKWTVGNKTDAGGLRFGEVYLTALLQKPTVAAAKM